MTYTPYIWPQLVALTLFAVLLVPVRRFRHLSGIPPFHTCLLMALLVTIFGLLDIATTNLPLKIAWSQLRFTSGAALPVAYLALTLAHTGRAPWLTRRRLLLLLIIPIMAQLLALTGIWPTLFRDAYRIELIGEFPVLRWNTGIGVWIFELYAVGMILAASAHLAIFTAHGRRRDTLALVAGVLAVAVTRIMTIWTIPRPLDISSQSMSLLLTGALGFWVLLRHQALGIAPVAYRSVVATIADPVIVLDTRRRIAIANPAAEKVCGLPHPYAGAPLDELPPEWAALFRRHATSFALREEVVMGAGAEQRVYDLTLSTLTGDRARDRGQLFLLHDLTERKQIEAALRQLSQAAAQAPTPIVVTNPQGDVIFVNPAFEQITGYSVAETLGQNPRVLKSGHHPPGFYEELWATICSGQTWHGEFLNRKRDGSLYWEQAAISPVTNGSGAITAFVAVKEDITARKSAEAQLSESEARYRLLADNIMDVAWILDLTTRRFRYVSASVEHLLGYTVEEVLQQELSEVITPESLAQLEEVMPGAIAQFRETGSGSYINEVEQTCRDGTTVWTEITGRYMLNPDNQHIEIFGVSRDITDRKRAESEVARTHARLQSLVNILQYFSPSIQGYLDYALGEAIRLTESTIGYIYFYSEAQQEFTLNTWSKGVMDACAIQDPATIYQLDKTGIWGEAVRQRRPIILNDYAAAHPLKRGYPEGHAPLSSFMTVPILKDDQIVAVVGLANKPGTYDETDVLQITLLMETVWSVLDQRRAEEALQRNAEELQVQNQELDAFAHTVAHDLRNSIGSISGAVELLREDEAQLPEDSAFALDAMIWSVSKLQTIVDELMLLSGVRKQAIEPVQLHMPRILAETRRRLQDQIEQTGADVTLLDADAWPVAMGHAAWVEEVWFNYLSNALKYGGSPPRITVGAGVQPDESARFWMHNTGSTISPEDRSRLFVPFARLNQVRTQGHGLGLSIVHRIIDRLGGQVGVESDRETGTTFYFTLPLAPVQELRVERAPGA